MTTLTFEQIKKLVLGAAYIEEGDGGISFFRFTREQQELYKNTCADFYMKNFATAGISLEFDTDSENLSLSFTVSKGSSRGYFTHSIFADGRRIGELSGDLGDNDQVSLSGDFDLGEGVKRVRIQFPWSVASRLVTLSLDDGAMAVPVYKKRKMLLLGDSITQGYDASRPEYAYAVRLADFLNAEARNKGIAGEKFFGALTSLKDDFEPDIITVAYGTNDWRHSTSERFERECSAFFKNLLDNYPSSKIYVITPLWRVDIDNEYDFSKPLGYVAKYIKQITRRSPNVTVINGFDLVPHRKRHFQPDGVHPKDSGFENYANNLCANKHFVKLLGE